MADCNEAIPVILKHEGGWSNHEADPGGATNRGIIFRLFKKYADDLGLEPNIQSLKELSEEDARTIYRREFWDKMRGDQINDQKVATIILDGFVNMGPRALKMVQKIVNVDTDGIFGPKTIAAINESDPKVFFDIFKTQRALFYHSLAERKPTMQVFLKGWLSRINSFNYA